MNSTQRREATAKLAFAAIISLIILAMIFIPSIGFIPLNFVDITIIHIPVLVGAIILGRKYGLFFGVIFGLGSLIKTFTLAELGGNAPFTNPLVSILPRIIFGYIIHPMFSLFAKKTNRSVSVVLTMIFATFIHSIIVLPMYYIVAKTGFYFFASTSLLPTNTGLFKFIFGLLIGNSIFEIIAAGIIGTAATIPLLVIQDQNNY